MKFKEKLLVSGQSLVEFALIFPILILIVLFIFDLGRVVYYYSVLSNLSREGARYGIVYAAQHPTENEGQIINAVSPIICHYALALDVGCPNPTLNVYLIDNDNNGRNEEIQVHISSGFSPVTPLIGAFLDLDENNQIILNSQSTMRIEH